MMILFGVRAAESCGQHTGVRKKKQRLCDEQKGYFLSDDESRVPVLSEFFPPMDLRVLPTAGPIFGISLSIFCAALRTPRVRSSTVTTPLWRSADRGAAAAPGLVTRKSASITREYPAGRCRSMLEL
jgi:hypothetical protein